MGALEQTCEAACPPWPASGNVEVTSTSSQSPRVKPTGDREQGSEVTGWRRRCKGREREIEERRPDRRRWRH